MSMKRNRRKPSEARRYDVEMIKDFVEHLLWELRTDQFESSGGAINPELVDMLGKYMTKRQTNQLLMSHVTKLEPDHEAVRNWNDARRKLRDRQIHALEALQPVFAEALALASGPNVCVKLMCEREHLEMFTHEIEEQTARFDGSDDVKGREEW
jgi:hypothetical protein